MAQWIQAVIAVFLALFTMWGSGGCLPIKGFPAEAGAVTQGIVEMVKDQGVLDQFASNLDANVQNPGLESYLRVTTAAGVRLVGTNGEVDLTTAGTGSQLPAGVRESLIAQLGGPISDQQREAILTLLQWNRMESAHNPVP